jgi:uncharacterized protein
MTYFFDTYALIEMIRGNPDYSSFVDEVIHTTALNLGELHYRFLRDGKPNPGLWYLEFRDNCIPVEISSIRDAMEFKYRYRKRKLSFIDAVGYATARENGLVFLTGDEGFRGLEGVEMVK